MRDPSLRPEDVVHLSPWVGAINQAAKTGIDVEDPFRVAALGLRESDFGYAPGYYPKGNPIGWGDDPDGEKGPRLAWAFGFFQFDRRYHLDWINSPQSKTVAGQAQLACRLLAQNRHWLRQAIKDPLLLERASYAAYNAGARGVLWSITDQQRAGNPPDPDRPTKGGDYSGWVFAKADALRAAHPGLFDTYVGGLVV